MLISNNIVGIFPISSRNLFILKRASPQVVCSVCFVEQFSLQTQNEATPLSLNKSWHNQQLKVFLHCALYRYIDSHRSCAILTWHHRYSSLMLVQHIIDEAI